MKERNLSRTLIKIIGCLMIFAIMIGAGYYYAKWYNYHERLLFYNTYHPDRDGLMWSWDLLPPPLSDYQGNTVFADFPNNMIAVVHFPAGDDGGSYHTSAAKDRFAIDLGSKTVVISKRPDTLVEVDQSGVIPVRQLVSGEAQRIYDSISKNSNRNVPSWKDAVHEQIVNLVQQRTTRESAEK
jgi:hypothetical protein